MTAPAVSLLDLRHQQHFPQQQTSTEGKRAKGFVRKKRKKETKAHPSFINVAQMITHL